MKQKVKVITLAWLMSREETQDKNNGKNIFLRTLWVSESRLSRK